MRAKRNVPTGESAETVLTGIARIRPDKLNIKIVWFTYMSLLMCRP